VLCCLALLAVVALLAVACGGDAPKVSPSGDVVVVLTSPTGNATPRPRKTVSPTPTASATPLKVCTPNPDPASPQVLQVLEPAPDAQVKSPFHVRGWGSNIGFQDRGVALAVVDAKQNVLQVLDLPPQPRTYRLAPPGLQVTENTKPFAADVVIANVKEPTPYCLWAYQETNESGRPKGVVQVPILVVP
jgi:hypothetical protein